MKFTKLITGSIVAASLFGVSLGSSFLNANATSNGNTSINDPGDITPSSQPGLKSDRGGDSNAKQGINSSANATVSAGLLKLDSVPNLSFGSDNINQYTDTLHLVNSGKSSPEDGVNNNGYLRVNDNRNTGSEGSGPWSVQAELGSFTNTDKDQVSTDNWAISLNQTSASNDESKNLHPIAQTLNSNSNPQTIISTSNDNDHGHGMNAVQYSDSSNDAELKTPYNVKLGHYAATINWNLTAYADSSVNSTDNETQTPHG